MKDVIERQTGSIEKATQELYQNCRDAKREKKDLYVDITLKKKSIMIKDNGCGMTEEVIREYFTVFGESVKRGDGNKVGDFGIGRGQIMNFGVCLWISGHSVILVDIRNKGLGYTLYTRKQFVEGTTFVCVFYRPLDWWKLNSLNQSLEWRLLPEPHYYIYLNNQTIAQEYKEYPEFSNETFRVFKHESISSFIYSQGIYVKNFKSNFQYSINIKIKSKLNTARNEFLETEPMYDLLQAKINEIEELMIVDKPDFTKAESRLTLSFLRDGRLELDSIINKRIVLTADNRLVSLKSLFGKEVMFGETNIWSDDCIHRGYTVLHKNNRGLLKQIFSSFKVALSIAVSNTRPEDIAKRGYFRDFDPSKVRKNKVYAFVPRDMNEKIFLKLPFIEHKRKVDLGESDIKGAWTNGYDYIKVNKNIIEHRFNKEEICVEVWRTLCHEYSHDQPSKEEDYHDDDFYIRFHDYIGKTAQMFANYMKKLTAKYLKERYITGYPVIN